jgi:hypothetical protein
MSAHQKRFLMMDNNFVKRRKKIGVGIDSLKR